MWDPTCFYVLFFFSFVIIYGGYEVRWPTKICMPKWYDQKEGYGIEWNWNEWSKKRKEKLRSLTWWVLFIGFLIVPSLTFLYLSWSSLFVTPTSILFPSLLYLLARIWAMRFWHLSRTLSCYERILSHKLNNVVNVS